MSISHMVTVSTPPPTSNISFAPSVVVTSVPVTIAQSFVSGNHQNSTVSSSTTSHITPTHMTAASTSANESTPYAPISSASYVPATNAANMQNGLSPFSPIMSTSVAPPASITLLPETSATSANYGIYGQQNGSLPFIERFPMPGTNQMTQQNAFMTPYNPSQPFAP